MGWPCRAVGEPPFPRWNERRPPLKTPPTPLLSAPWQAARLGTPLTFRRAQRVDRVDPRLAPLQLVRLVRAAKRKPGQLVHDCPLRYTKRSPPWMVASLGARDAPLAAREQCSRQLEASGVHGHTPRLAPPTDLAVADGSVRSRPRRPGHTQGLESIAEDRLLFSDANSTSRPAVRRQVHGPSVLRPLLGTTCS